MVSLHVIGQQDELHTQFGYNKMILNPAFAGADYYTSVTAMVRDQWNGLQGAPTYQLVSASVPFQKTKVGLGFVGKRTTIGIEENLELKAMYAYQIRVGQSKLRLALQAAGRRYNIDYTDDRIFAIDGINEDPNLLEQKFSTHTFNAGLGALYRIKKMYFGVSIPRLIRSKYGYEKSGDNTYEARILYSMIGSLFTVSETVKVSTQALFKVTENAPYDLDIQGGLIFKDDYHFGINYRMGGGQENIGESLALLIGLQPTAPLFFGFSYDFTFSSIRKYESGTLEAVIQYNIGRKKDHQHITNPRYF